MMNVGNPQLAFDFSQIPNDGVGLARLEFIINNNINVHPKAVLDYPNVDGDLKKAVESAARGYASPRAFFVEKLARSEEHTSELQSLMRNSYAVFCLKQK